MKKYKQGLFLLSTVTFFASAAFAHPTIDLKKLKPTELHSGPYSYLVPPYSYYYYHNIDKLGFHLDWVKRSGAVYPLVKSDKPFTVNYTFDHNTYTLDQYYKRNAVLGFLVLKNNHIIVERYFQGANENSRFISNSVGKSITAELFGIALENTKGASVNDLVTKYLPELKDSGYKNVTLKQVLQMATGVDATENGSDPHSTISQLSEAVTFGNVPFSTILKSLKRNPKVKPGTEFDYESANTQVLGMIIEKMTGMSFSDYLQKMIWSKIGAQSDAFIYRSTKQPEEPTFGCINVTLRDYGRFGLMMMNNGVIGNTRVISASWVKESTTPHLPQPTDHEFGYGYQWWIPQNTDGAYEAMGVYGQILYVNPKKHIVIIESEAWPKPDAAERWTESTKVIDAIVAKLS